MSALVRRTDHTDQAPGRFDRTSPAPVIEATAVAKSYGATRAIRTADLRIVAGEIHALVGENGSGKSSLVKILSGVQQPDAGTLLLRGRAVSGWRSPREAARSGVTAVYQEVLTVPERSLVENVWLGAEGVFRPAASGVSRRRRAEVILGQLLDPPPDSQTPAGLLSLSQRQATCICRALLRDPELLILDEATSALDVDTRDRLFALLRARVATGKAVLFISHRMDEIEDIADRVTVMKSGETIACLERSKDRAERLVALMSGTRQAATAASGPKLGAGPLVLSARELRLTSDARAIEFALHAGEIVGIAGLEGHGQSRFLAALAGRAQRASGVVRHTDVQTPICDPEAAAAQGIVYVPRERRDEALFESLSVRDNFAVPTLRRDRRWGLVSNGGAERRLNAYILQLRIRVARSDAPIGTLSGGNQQKVVLARWLAAEPAIVLLDDPTRGIDVGAKRDIYRILHELTGNGTAVVMVSTDLDEHLELMHRVLVFRESGVFQSFERHELSRERLIGAFFGRQTR